MSTREALKKLPRPVRAVELPGGATVHVRDLSLAELRRIDERAAERPEGPGRNVRWTLLLCTYALAEPDGSAAFPDPTEADVGQVESDLTTSQARAVADAAIPTKADAKNV